MTDVYTTFTNLSLVEETTLHLESTMYLIITEVHLRGEIPQTEGPIPGTRQSKLSIRGDDNITYKVRVTLQGALGDAIVGFITGQLPHDDGLV